MIIQINPKLITYDKSIQGLCKKNFYGHPKGCPNFGAKQGCPPQPLINKVLDFSQEMYVVHTEFPVGVFAQRMKDAHPGWNPRQWYNPRLWQPKARKIQRTEEEKAKKQYSVEMIIQNPEAHGIDVTDMMQKIGIGLQWQWPPSHGKDYAKIVTYRVSLAGYALR
jgi:predicted metal-binding protein